MAVARFTSTGALDTSFSGDGKQWIDFSGTTAETANDVMCWPPQGCFVFGDYNSVDSASNKFAITKLNSSGNVDASFGLQTTTFPGKVSPTGSGRIAITNDVKIVVSGKVNTTSGVGQLAVARYTTAGALDSTFGTGGRVTIGSPGIDIAAVRTLAIDPTTSKVLPAGFF